jgi:hypothetical protein
LVTVAGDENAVLEWFRTGPPRRVLPYIGTRVVELGLSEAVAEECVTATAEAWGLNHRVFETAASVLELLHQAGIEVMAFKGLALAGEVYSPHRLRAIGDLDLLVRPSQHRRAVRVLEQAGWTRDAWAPRPLRGAASSTLGRNGMTSVDVHSRPARNLPHRFPGEPSCWRDAEYVGPAHPLAGLDLLRPSPERHMVILAAHLAQEANHDLVHPCLDIHRLLMASATNSYPPIDRDRLVAAADDEGARGRVAHALALVVDGLGAPGPGTLPPPSRRRHRQEIRVQRADLNGSNMQPGLVPQLGRMWSYVQVATVGQGPIAATQVAINVVANRLWVQRHPPTRRSNRSNEVASTFSQSREIPGEHSWFGTADDGTVIEIESFDPIPGDHLASIWPPRGLLRTAIRPMTGPDVVVHVNGDLTNPTITLDGTAIPHGWDALESALGLFAVERLTGLVAIHAAVWVWDGAAVMIPGPSHAGKSTLAVAAARDGATIASDEFALVDPVTGLIQGWNRRVRIRTPTGAERVDLAVDIQPTTVAVVATVVYGDGATSLRKLSPAETVFALLANTVCAQSRPVESLAAATYLARSVNGYQGTRGEAVEAVTVLHDLCHQWQNEPREFIT